ncbi:MAG: phospho-N-acetylmuramoyl-pentapeptide-transferase [Planctomycetota bacterium]
MLPWLYDLLSAPLNLGETPLRILQYASVRCVGAFIVAFGFVLLLGRRTAAWLYRRGMRDRVRDYGEYFNHSKSGTPTMGGLLIVGGIILATLLFSEAENRVAHLLVLTVLWYGALGCVDDMMKVVGGSSDAGMSRNLKFFLQALFAFFFGAIILSDGTSPFPAEIRTNLYFPFPRPEILGPIDLGYFYLPFVVVALVSITNAINFADGLDGLAVLPTALTAAVFGVVAYMMWNNQTSKFFAFDYMPAHDMQAIAIFASAVVGSCFGFLWFNGYPAQMFMGDTGAMALGGSLGAMAILSKQELLFLIAGGVFVFEAFSVLIQDYVGIRWIGRRIFFRAPAHHGYQHQGLAETKVVLRFWIVSLLCCVLSFATLKLR